MYILLIKVKVKASFATPEKSKLFSCTVDNSGPMLFHLTISYKIFTKKIYFIHKVNK